MKQTMINYSQRDKFDNLYTPDNAVLPLIKYIPKDKIIWECCDYGQSNITKLFKSNGNQVISTDIIHGFDFLKDIPDFEFDMIITNCPYSLKNKFIEKCYSYNKPFCLLLPLTTLEGKARGDIFKEKGISVIVLNKRIDFTGKKNNWFNTSWFCYDIIKNDSLIFEQVN